VLTLCDLSCLSGTAGWLLAQYDWLQANQQSLAGSVSLLSVSPVGSATSVTNRQGFQRQFLFVVDAICPQPAEAELEMALLLQGLMHGSDTSLVQRATVCLRDQVCLPSRGSTQLV